MLDKMLQHIQMLGFCDKNPELAELCLKAYELESNRVFGLVDWLADNLTEDLASNGIITAISFEYCDLGKNSIAVLERLASRLTNLPNLKEINLSGNELSDEEAGTMLSTVLRKNSLTIIDLSRNNHLSDAVTTLLAEALTNSSSLRHIDLAYTNLGPAGAKAIARALAINSSLKSIRIFCGNKDIGYE